MWQWQYDVGPRVAPYVARDVAPRVDPGVAPDGGFGVRSDPGVDLDPELAALQVLARELAVRKMGVGMRDALPALVVNTAFPGVQLYVFVSCSGQNFTWQRADNRHPITDASGAAEKIATYVRLWNSTTGGGAHQ